MKPICERNYEYVTLPTFFYINTGSIHTVLNADDLASVLHTLSQPNVIAQTKLYTDRFFLIKEDGVLCPNVSVSIANTDAFMGSPAMRLTLMGMDECTNRIGRIQKIIHLTEFTQYEF